MDRHICKLFLILVVSVFSLECLGQECQITIRKSGLDVGESAIFKISRITQENSTSVVTPYSTIIVTATEDNQTIEKKVDLDSGNWKVEETGWTWTYEPLKPITKWITGESTAADKIFEFSNTKKTSVPTNSEAVVRNDFGESSATSL